MYHAISEFIAEWTFESESTLKVLLALTDASLMQNDAGLSGEIEMYGEKWTRSKVLSSLIRHEIHHRAQMTVLMRQAGLKVPGVYGPSKEEWAQYNMKSPE